MKAKHAWRVSAVLLLLTGACAQQEAARVATFDQDMASDDPQVRRTGEDRAVEQGASAIATLGEVMASENAETARSAKRALERIVHHAARPAILPLDRRPVLMALIQLVQRDKPLPIRREAVYLLCDIADESVLPWIEPLLNEPDMREAARFALQRIPGGGATQALIRAMPTAPADFRLRLIDALGDRGDPAAVEWLVRCARVDELDMAGAAMDALARIGPPSAIWIGFRITTEDEKALAELFSAETLAAEPRERFARFEDAYLRYAEKLTERGDTEPARGLYLAVLDRAGSEHHRVAAIIGLGAVAHSDDAAKFIGWLDADAITVRKAAEDALIAAKARDLNTTLAEAVATAAPRVKVTLLRILAARHADGLNDLLGSALNDEDPQVQAVAYTLMAEQGDPGFVPVLKAAAENGAPPVRHAALAALVQRGDQEFVDGENKAAALLYSFVLEHAADADVQAEALRGVEAVADPEQAAIVRPFLTTNVANQACWALIAMARTAAEHQDSATAEKLLMQAVTYARSGAPVTKAREQLSAIGADTKDLGQRVGFITNWQIIGTFPNPKGAALETAYFPEETVDLKKGGEINGKTLSWKPVTVEALPAIVDVRALFKDDYHDVCAYGYAELNSPKAQPVKVKFGSDDGLVIWVNGTKIAATNPTRACVPDDDVVETKLQAGRNVILVKSLQNGGDWQFCVRLTDAQDEPLDLRAMQ